MSDIPHKTKITTALGTFEFEGSQEFIEKQIEKFVEIAKQSPVVPTASIDQNSNPKSSIGGKYSTKVSTRKTVTEQPQMIPNLITDKTKIDDLRSFYASKHAENHIDNFAIFTLWLKNNAALPEVSISEMWTLYKILGIKPPKVLIQVFRDGKSKKAYFEASAATGKYYLTPFGETFVEHDLPRKTVDK